MMGDSATGGEEIVDNELIVGQSAVETGAAVAEDVAAAEDYATVDPGAPKRQPPTATKVCYTRRRTANYDGFFPRDVF